MLAAEQHLQQLSGFMCYEVHIGAQGLYCYLAWVYSCCKAAFQVLKSYVLQDTHKGCGLYFQKLKLDSPVLYVL